MEEMLLFKCLSAPTGVMLPQENCLVVNELDTRCGNDFPSEFFTLQEIEEVQAHRVLNKSKFNILDRGNISENLL